MLRKYSAQSELGRTGRGTVRVLADSKFWNLGTLELRWRGLWKFGLGFRGLGVLELEILELLWSFRALGLEGLMFTTVEF